MPLNEKKTLVEEFQNSFSGGMNLIEDDTAIGNNEYRQAFNCLNRYGKLEPIRDATIVNPEITGKKQGLYGFGEYLILFSEGYAYYKHYTQHNFINIPSFKMDSTVERLYAEFVPASMMNLQRQMADSNSITSPVNFVNTRIAPSPAAMIVNDGVNQPRILYYDVSVKAIVSRATATYRDWDNDPTKNAREYVPIGTDLLYLSGAGVLLMVSADRKSIYRSVTGRPLDFMVNISDSGEKAAKEEDGGAISANYCIGYDDITSIKALSDDTFLAGTKTPQSYIIRLNRDRLVWGEPTFERVGAFSGSPLNSFSVTDILGETAFITSEGILSFNATQQQRVENSNNIFSLKISAVFKDIGQKPNECAVGVFDDLVFFSVNSIYGPVLAIYDKLRQSWSSFYYSQNGIKIKQFVSLVPNAREFYGISWDDQIYKFFSSKEFSEASVKTKSFNSENPLIEQKLNTLSAIVSSSQKVGTISVTPYVDEVDSAKVVKGVIVRPINNILLDFNVRPLIGFKVSYSITWSGGGSLTNLYHNGNVVTMTQSAGQAVTTFNKK